MFSATLDTTFTYFRHKLLIVKARSIVFLFGLFPITEKDVFSHMMFVSRVSHIVSSTLFLVLIRGFLSLPVDLNNEMPLMKMFVRVWNSQILVYVLLQKKSKVMTSSNFSLVIMCARRS